MPPSPTQPRSGYESNRLLDGTPYFAPLGALQFDPDEGKVCCHLCGEWFERLGQQHLPAAHGWSASRYRDAFELPANLPLQAPSISEAQRSHLRERMRTDRRIAEGMQRGADLARSGELPAAGTLTAAAAARTHAGAVRKRRSGTAGGTARRDALREQREARARELGFPGLADYLRTRYVAERWTVGEIANQLGVAYSTVTADMDRAGIQRSRQQRGTGRRT